MDTKQVEPKRTATGLDGQSKFSIVERLPSDISVLGANGMNSVLFNFLFTSSFQCVMMV